MKKEELVGLHGCKIHMDEDPHTLHEINGGTGIEVMGLENPCLKSSMELDR